MWSVLLVQKPSHSRRNWPGGRRPLRAVVTHCATVAQAVRTAQRQYPGWTVVAAERQS
jgi:hypothetical protein